MNELLYETSSIFSRNGNQSHTEVDPTVGLSQEQVTEIEKIQEPVEFARTIHFSNHSEAGKLNLIALFPDSRFAVLKDRNLNHFYAANIDDDAFIVEVPFSDFSIVAVGAEIVVLEIHTMNGPKTIKLEGRDYCFLEGVEIDRKEKDLVINGKSYSRETTELEPPEKLPDGVRYFFKDANLVIRGTTDLFEQDKKDGKMVLVANANGCYIGYYMLVREGDGMINFNGTAYEVLSRLTLALTVVRSVRDFKVYLVPCRNQELIPIEQLATSDWESIPIQNGVALLFGPPSAQSKLHVFTPSWQKIVLSRSMKINYKAIGNGIYIPSESVIVLDSGMLRFVEKIDKKTIYLPTDRITLDLPVPYLGDL